MTTKYYSLFLLLLLGACAPTLADNADMMSRHYTSDKNYKGIAECIDKNFDAELKFGWPAKPADNSLRIVEAVGKASVVTKVNGTSVMLVNLTRKGSSTAISLDTSNDQRLQYTDGVLDKADAFVKACL